MQSLIFRTGSHVGLKVLVLSDSSALYHTFHLPTRSRIAHPTRYFIICTNTADVSFCGLLLLLNICAMKGKGLILWRLLCFNNAWSWRLSPGFYSFTRPWRIISPASDRTKGDEKREGSATSMRGGESRLHVVGVPHHATAIEPRSSRDWGIPA